MPIQRTTKEDACPANSESSDKKKMSRLAWLFFAFWAGVITAPLAALATAHMATLPVATKSVTPNPTNGWKLVHVLSEECSCSRSVMDYLLERGSSDGIAEEIVLLGESSQLRESLVEAGYAVQLVDPESFCTQFQSEGVPFFQILEGDAPPRYSGAYFKNAYRGTSGFLDLSTLEHLQAGGLVVNRPVYGCPTSDRLKRMLDPFKLK